jgi:hypothetical protein
MKALVVVLVSVSLLSIGASAIAQKAVFFEEQFDGPTLDPSTWRTEILTSGPRFCPDSNPGGPGHWVDEGVECHAVAAYSPYGSATLTGGLIHVSSTNGQAFPFLVSRLPGSVPTFPSSGDFTVTVRMRFDRITPWGTFVDVLDWESTEPIGTNNPGPEQDVLHIEAGGLYSFLGGSMERIADVPSPTELHDYGLECVGNLYTVTIDGQVVYGPVASDMRPTSVCLGNPVLAYWYPTDWTSLSVDYFRIEVPGPVPVQEHSWGAIKAMYR